MQGIKAPDPTEVGGFYDRFAQFSVMADPAANLHFGYWDSPDDDSSLAEAAARLTEIMIDKARVGTDRHLLDVGCGIGGPGVRLAQAAGARVTGVTVSQEQVRLGNQRAAEAGLADRVRFELADAMDLPYEADSFDAAWALESMIHMPDRARVLGEMGRVVRPGGRVVLTDIFERAPIPEHKRAVVEAYYRETLLGPAVTVDDYPGLLRGAGLMVDEIIDISENVMAKTMREASRQKATVPAEIEEMHGDDPAYQLDPGDLAEVWELGYLLVVAHRPVR
ncbi:cyclopropane-fatty-acyl-phospholipid synthase family protein [Streptomyces pactum]|uniref:SAM-dependent methyltransferase n=1 Tax=Streptomyces pactum TaxID=68249 RepID=A0A1S6J3J7_9ACTN|nr:methyltransferase domain-containing protein [Streptomyces pactum]AQS66352.1 SAM-dependent methyltransferase [Streptomyces pactum]